MCPGFTTRHAVAAWLCIIYICGTRGYIFPLLFLIYIPGSDDLFENSQRVRPHRQLAELYTWNLVPVDVNQLLDSSCSTLVSTVALAIFLSSSLCYPDLTFLFL